MVCSVAIMCVARVDDTTRVDLKGQYLNLLSKFQLLLVTKLVFFEIGLLLARTIIILFH